MKQELERKWELRAVSLFIALIVALMGFSAALATREEAGVTPAAEHEASAYRDPSLAGLSVAADAADDGAVEIFY